MTAKKKGKKTRLSSVKVEGIQHRIAVPISSKKPEIPQKVFIKWQNIVNLLSTVLIVPASLVMRLDKEFIEVFVASAGDNNPYEKGEKADLGLGLYCETVVGKRKPLLVPNALADDNWKDNPDVKLKMISYYGLPIAWPDGEVFGTLCVLDYIENNYSELYFDLMKLFKENIELDLELLQEKEDLRELNYHKEMIIRETHHRIKNNFNMLISLLHLQKKGPDINADDLILELESKIAAFSLIHEKLSASINRAGVSIKNYITELVQSILAAGNLKNIAFSLQSPEISGVNTDKMLTYGLIINELVTNSMKHAYKDVKKPEITITISMAGSGKLKIEYGDNGPGLPDNFDQEKIQSLGINIINTLAKQLHCEIAFHKKRQPLFEIICTI